MSELSERRWAVLSERGREEGGLTYEEAAGLVQRLRGEDVSGLCVITDEAASHVPSAKKSSKKSGGGTRKRRAKSKVSA